MRPRIDRYSEVSSEIHEIFSEFTDLIEPLSLDEAFLDVTQNKLSLPLARDIAVLIKQKILTKTGLTASAGVGPNKFIAKLATDLKKPNGLVVVSPDKILMTIQDLPVDRLWGIGPVSAKNLGESRIFFIKDLWSLSEV